MGFPDKSRMISLLRQAKAFIWFESLILLLPMYSYIKLRNYGNYDSD
jgi:hypothetical protein